MDRTRLGVIALATLLLPLCAAPALGDLYAIQPGETWSHRHIGPGESDTYVFTAHQGEGAEILMGRESGGISPQVILIGPGGEIARVWGYYAARLIQPDLPETGTYSIVCMDHNGTGDADYGVSLITTRGSPNSTRDEDPDGDYVSNGSNRTASIVTGDLDAYAFYGERGGSVTILMGRREAGISPQVDLLAPDGEVLASGWGYYSVLLSLADLPRNAWYYVVCSDHGGTGEAGHGVSFTITYPVSPYVVSTEPVDGAQAVSPQAPVVVHFSKPMLKSSGESHTTFRRRVGGGFEDVPFAFQWPDGLTMMLYPADDLAFAAQYRLRVARGAESRDGHTMRQDCVVESTTTSSLIRSSSPSSGATGCSRYGPVTIQFRWPVDQASAESHFALAPRGGSPLAGAFRWIRHSRQMAFTPSAPLAPGRLHRVTLAPGIAPLSGPPTTWSEGFAFTTGAHPVVVRAAPRGTNVSLGANIVVDFDVPMNRASVEAALTAEPAVPGLFAWANGDRRVRLDPTALLQPDTSYRITIGPAAQSATGTPMGFALSWTFRSTSAAGRALAVSALAMPTARGVQVVMTLSGPAEVGIDLLNVAGRIVGGLAPRRLGPGTSTLAWRPWARNGAPLPAGTYLVRVRARGEGGQHTQALAPVHLMP